MVDSGELARGTTNRGTGAEPNPGTFLRTQVVDGVTYARYRAERGTWVSSSLKQSGLDRLYGKDVGYGAYAGAVRSADGQVLTAPDRIRPGQEYLVPLPPQGSRLGASPEPASGTSAIRAGAAVPATPVQAPADRGTGTNKPVAVLASRAPPTFGPATASRAIEERSIDPAVSHRPAADALRGTELYYIVGDEYFRGTAAPLKAYKSDHYWVAPQIRREDGQVVAYIAYNPDVRRNEFVIGPNELGFFFEHESLYKWLAASTYPVINEPRPYEVAHGRMIASSFRGNVGGMVEHFGDEWAQALTDPAWYVRFIGSLTGIKTAPATSESATIIPPRGSTTSTQTPRAGATTSTRPPPAGTTSNTASTTEAAAVVRAREVTRPQSPGPPNNPPVTSPVVPAPTLQSKVAGQPSTQATSNEPPSSQAGSQPGTKPLLNEPSPHARAGPLTGEERLRAERLLNRSLGQAPDEPVPVTRWGGQSKTVSTRVIKAGPDGKPLVAEFSGRGVNGELVTVRTISGEGSGRVIQLEIRNINSLERVARDAELARAMKAAGMGDWKRDLGHVQPSAAKGAEAPYNFQSMDKDWNRPVPGRANRATAERLFKDYLDKHPDSILNTKIQVSLAKNNKLLGERFVITDFNGKAVLDVEVTTGGKLVDRVNVDPGKGGK